jgi:phosphatidylserine/phosphatidylglycerophosphate/cardiolipin synthase-like enzyme
MTAAPSPAGRDRRPSDGVPEPIHDAPSRAIAIALPDEMRRYARTATKWRIGCDVAVLRDGGETYAAMLAAITHARRSICLETYILASDAVGERFKQALVERARAGVTIRLIYDAVGSFGLSSDWLAELREAGGQVLDFNPIAVWRRKFNLSHRDHRKILVVDDEVAFTGGLNIAKAGTTCTAGCTGRSCSISRGCSGGPGFARAAPDTRHRRRRTSGPRAAA